ncbi:hypothetical protein MAHJHV51_56930 [Mycobacterium avium subsp. hominissuis]
MVDVLASLAESNAPAAVLLAAGAFDSASDASTSTTGVIRYLSTSSDSAT